MGGNLRSEVSIGCVPSRITSSVSQSTPYPMTCTYSERHSLAFLNTSVVPGGPAEASGLFAMGDHVVAVNDKSVRKTPHVDFIESIISADGPIKFTVQVRVATIVLVAANCGGSGQWMLWRCEVNVWLWS